MKEATLLLPLQGISAVHFFGLFIFSSLVDVFVRRLEGPNRKQLNIQTVGRIAWRRTTGPHLLALTRLIGAGEEPFHQPTNHLERRPLGRLQIPARCHQPVAEKETGQSS